MNELSVYLYKIHPIRPDLLVQGPTELEAKSIDLHFQYLKNLTDQGVVLLAGRTLGDDLHTFGIIIFVAESLTAAQTVMNNDPAVQNRVFSATCFPFSIALVSKQLQTIRY